MNIDAFIAKWRASEASERANKDAFLVELCDVLGVARPDPATGKAKRDLYVFEKDVRIPRAGGAVSVGFIDLYKHGSFILEAKQGSEQGQGKIGTARRKTPAWNIAMRDAFGQALGYAKFMDEPPPFVITADIGYCFDLYATFDGSTAYRPFPNALTHRIYVSDLAEHRERLRSIFLDPASLDPAHATTKVTREVAERLATLARSLEASGHAAKSVATFLMRCIFTMFAEDVGLLPEGIFTGGLEKHWIPSPRSFAGGVETLWSAMNDGASFGFVGKLLQFNGGLFRGSSALPLSREELQLLLDAAKCSWRDVEPAIFGTLLERALDPEERHKLGAHFTPRAYVERLVRPTIEEPLREDWEATQAEVRQLVEDGKLGGARTAVRAFLEHLSRTRVLDPACGSGNFLYVALDLFKTLEGEVLGLLRDLERDQAQLGVGLSEVTPAQFLGIELNPRAKEIAELVLWIGYLQWHFRVRGRGMALSEPIMRDYQNIRCGDAVLAYERKDLERDHNGKPVSRWDGKSMMVSSVTGKLVPDDDQRVVVEKLANPHRPEWPAADFIVGNPPFIGKLHIVSALGDGYAEALRRVYKGDVPDSADFVMYWWHLAASLAAQGKVRRFGFVTTNSVVQVFNRRVIAQALDGDPPVHLTFAIPDHPWADTSGSAAVRIAMSVVAPGRHPGRLATVVEEGSTARHDGAVDVTLSELGGVIHADLKVGANVASAQPLLANSNLTSAGVMLGGRGFLLVDGDPLDGPPKIIKRILHGSDIVQRSRSARVIDFYGLSEDQARDAAPQAFQRILNRVKPERDANRRTSRRERWWLFSEAMLQTRKIIAGMRRYIGTPETSKHRVFVFVDGEVLPEHPLLAIGLEDAFYLGVLSSRVHVVWALAAGGRLGIGNDPRYNKTRCFEPFPFPDVAEAARDRIRQLGEALDKHRKQRQVNHPELTITAMYNVLEKLRVGEPLSTREHIVHENGLVSVLKKLHDDLDTAVLDAYGWPTQLSANDLLERVVALSAERREKESRGHVGWLRPEFQRRAVQTVHSGLLASASASGLSAVPPMLWPPKLPEQIAAVRRIVGRNSPCSAQELVATFDGARTDDVELVLESLAALGLVVTHEEQGVRCWIGTDRLASSRPPPLAQLVAPGIVRTSRLSPAAASDAEPSPAGGKRVPGVAKIRWRVRVPSKKTAAKR